MSWFHNAAVTVALYVLLVCQKVDSRVGLPVPTRTTQVTHVAASPLPRITNEISTSTIGSHLRRQAQSPGKILLLTGYQTLILSDYPQNVCGLLSGNPASVYACSIGQSCAAVGSNLCCASDGGCTYLISACYGNSRSGGYYASTLNGELTCGSASPICYSLSYPGGYYAYGCSTIAVVLGIVPAANVLSYFGGYTLVYSADRSGTLTFEGTVASKTSTVVVPTNVVGFLNRISDGTPSCVSNMTAACPSLYTAAQGCWNMTNPKKCFCPSIKSIHCPGICATGEGPAAYTNWVLKMCDNNDTSDYNATARTNQFKQQWVDFQTFQDEAYSALFPWQWQVKYQQNAAVGANASSYACPSIQAKLGSFAVVNVVVFIVAAIIGRRDVVKKITCRLYGKRGDHSAFIFTAILSIVLNLSANLINAAIIRRNPGFRNINMGSLVLFWASRPRLAWAVGLLIKRESEKEIYWSLGASAILAEIILQAVGSVYIGITGNWARRYRFYLAHHLDNVPHGNDALLMYGGALLWLVAIGGAAIKAFLTYTSVGRLLMAGLGIVSQFLARVSKYVWHWTCWLLVSLAKFVWKSLIVLGKSIRWSWRWLRIGVATVHLYSLRNIHNRFGWNLPVVPPRPEWPQGSQQPLNLEPRPRFPPKIERTLDQMTDDFRDNIILIMMFLVIPFIGQWLFWTGYLQMAGSLYCPPEIWNIAGVWSFFSIVGAFFGATA